MGVIARLAAGPCFISLLISRAFVSHGLHCKKGTSSRREISRGPWWTQSKTWLWVVGLIVVGRTRVTWIAGLTSCRPGMILLAATVVATAAHATLPTLSALGLGSSRHFVTIDRAAVDQSKGAASLGLSAEGNVVPIDGTGEGGRSTLSIHGARKLGAVLLQLQRALFCAIPALPGHRPLASDIGGLAVALSCILRQQAGS